MLDRETIRLILDNQALIMRAIAVLHLNNASTASGYCVQKLGKRADEIDEYKVRMAGGDREGR